MIEMKTVKDYKKGKLTEEDKLKIKEELRMRPTRYRKGDEINGEIMDHFIIQDKDRELWITTEEKGNIIAGRFEAAAEEGIVLVECPVMSWEASLETRKREDEGIDIRMMN